MVSVVPPTVAGVFPANGTTNYPTNGVIVVRFTEPLQTPVTLAAAQSAINAGLPSGVSFSPTNSTAAARAHGAEKLVEKLQRRLSAIAPPAPQG